MSDPATYNFHLIFKGLFRCVPSSDKKKLDVYLVDARSPKASAVTHEPLRDHRAAIEFRFDDWHNKAEGPLRNFVKVNKSVKGEVGLYLLERQDVRIKLGAGQLSPALTFIDDDSPTSFLNLPTLDQISPGSAAIDADVISSGKSCAARVLGLDWGEVRSERLSTRGTQRLRWSYSIPRERSMIQTLRTTPSPQRDQLRQELLGNAREINLDLRITARVPADAFVFVDPNPFPDQGFAADPPAFMLRPRVAGQDLEVWIKNRELDVILTEADDLGDTAGCLDGEFVDHDFELQYLLSAVQVQNKLIPYRSDMLDNGPISNGGCACGGCA